MFHNSSNRYTGYNMTRSQRAARNLADVGHNIARSVANVVVIKPQRLVSQMFNLNHHVDYISSRHQRRVDQRIAGSQPAHSAQKAALDAQNAQQAEQAEQAQVINAVDAAFSGYGMLFLDRLGREDELKAPALRAMKELYSDGLITEEEFNNFTNINHGESYFSSKNHRVNRDFFPLDIETQLLCHAAIGQAWIDEKLCPEIENAVPNFKITAEACASYLNR
jgi:hypothetical protein